MKKYRRGIFIVAYARTKRGIEYLVLKRRLHWNGWEFPKGGIEKNENYIHVVKREVLEETGKKPLKIINLNVNGKYKYKKKLKDRPGIIGQSYKLYATEIKRENIKIDRFEHSGYKWLNFEKAVKKLTWKNQRESLKIVNKFLKNE